MTNGDDWAFPRGEYGGGMTKREWMGLKILSSILTRGGDLIRKSDVALSVQIADDLIDELNKPKEPHG
jgi:hypothetical protein